MKYKADINIMPQKALLDPQGKAVGGSMKNIGLSSISDVRIGKHITIEMDAAGEDEAKKIADDACKKLLANLITESYEFSVSVAE